MIVVAKLGQSAVTDQIMYCSEKILLILQTLHCDWLAMGQQVTTPGNDVLGLELVSFTSYSNLITSCISILQRS